MRASASAVATHTTTLAEPLVHCLKAAQAPSGQSRRSRPALATITAIGGMTSAMPPSTAAHVVENWLTTSPASRKSDTATAISTR